ncbi:MAG TPA: endonuclease [Elusimicrobiales bacterium]|nr:endonuclease [Elusimicrobiales bacterium]
MKRINAVLSLAVITSATALSLFAQAPALDALNASLSVQGLALTVPAVPAPAPYGAGVLKSNLTGEQLFAYLHTATDFSAQKTPSSYKASKAFMYSKADNTGCNGTPGILTLYSQVCAKGSSSDGNSYKEQADANSDGVAGDFINAEHIWPQSYFNSNLPMVADLHHLAATFSVPNGRRGNLKFGMVANSSYATSAGSKLGGGMYEPANAAKGNVARAMFYFVVRYYDRSIRNGMNYSEFWTKNLPMLLEWNRQDPPDANELRRNDQVESYQGNRNPFIDDYTLADKIGTAVFAAH